MILTIIFLLIPISSVGLMFVKDRNGNRREIMNVLLLINTFLFLGPLIQAYTSTPAGESMWNENTGGGANLWMYIIILPVCVIIQAVLATLKIVFSVEKK